MSPEAITLIVGVLSFGYTALGAVLLVTWRTATWKTDHERRILVLEQTTAAEMREVQSDLRELTRSVNKLRETIAFNTGRGSQGQYDAGQTEPPRRGT